MRKAVSNDTARHGALIALLEDGRLEDCCGKKTLERGHTYAASGAVTITGEDGEPAPALHAVVRGTEDYTTSLLIEENELAGSCDCPSAGSGWFCKHMVAVAIVWRHRLTGTEPQLDESARKKIEASAKRAQTVKQRREALQEFLRQQPANALAQKLIDLADSFPFIERELKSWQKLAGARGDPADTRKLLTRILSVAGPFLPWNETGTWLRQAEPVLALLQKAREQDARSAVMLGLHALRRCWAALEKADDSSGLIGEFTREIGKEWLHALQAAGPQAASFGEGYLRLQREDPFGSYDDAAAEVAMGSAALNQYRESLAGAWQETSKALQARRAERQAKHGSRTAGREEWLPRDEAQREADAFERLHLVQLERMGDIDAMLSVLRLDLSSPWRYLQVGQLLERHNRQREAFANAEAAYREFPQDRRVQDELLRCYERDGWTEEAYALRRSRYDSEPSVEGFHATMKAGRMAGKDAETLRTELLGVEERRELSAQAAARRYGFPAPRNPDQPPPRQVTLRAAILGSEERWEEACALAQPPHVCQVEVLQQIAVHLPARRGRDAVALLQRALGNTLGRETSPYRQSLELVRLIAQRLKGAERTRWLAQLRAEYKAKRNFVRGLPE